MTNLHPNHADIYSERVKKRSRGSLTSFLGETHQDSGVACTSKIRELRIYYNTPNNALEREMAQVFNTKN